MPNRRDVLAAAALAASPIASATAAPRKPAPDPKTFLLVHGTGHGGWCWTPVARLLRQMGHTVYAPSLTGCGDRYHLRSPQIGLETHIEDLTSLIDVEDLQKVVMVGHSYGGYPMTGACDRRRERIAHAVYMDAPAPRDGDYNAKGLGAEGMARMREQLIDGYLMSSNAPAVLAGLGIPAENTELTAWVAKRLRPHPFRTWTDPIRLAHGGSDGLPRSYVFGAAASPMSPLRRYAMERKVDATFAYQELPCGHDMMLLLPDACAKLLAGIPV
jgi:pimeloyl-ACP methyl ester carboxylesterase